MTNIVQFNQSEGVTPSITDQILEKLDFPVEKTRLFTTNGNTPEVVEVEGFKSITRTDTGEPLSVVSNQYEIIKYRDTIEPLAEMIEAMGFQPRQCFLKDNGASMVLNAKSPETFEINGDKHTPTLWISNSYDRTSSLVLRFGFYRIVCSNGMVVPSFEGGTLDLKIRHTKNAMNTYNEWKDQIADLSWMERFKHTLEAMNEKRIPDDVAESILMQVFGAKDSENKNVVKAMVLMRNGTGQYVSQHERVTGWNLLNGITEVTRDYIDGRDTESKHVSALKTSHTRIEKAIRLIMAA